MATQFESAAVLRALRDENVTIRREKDDLRRENEELRKKFEEFESRFACCRNSKKRTLQMENDKFRTQNEALAKDVASMRVERENMAEKARTLSDALSKVEILNKQKADLEIEKHTLQQTVKKLNLNSKREKETMLRQCDMLQKQVLQQEEDLQDREVTRLKIQALTEENQALRKKTVQLQLENHHMTRRFQYENDLKRLHHLHIKRDGPETLRSPLEHCEDRVVTWCEGEDENIALQEQAQVSTLVQRYEQILDELGRENQSVHKRNGDLEKEVVEFKRTVCMEAMKHHFEGYQEEASRSCDGENASQVVGQQELEERFRQDYSRIQQQNKALEQELREVKDMLHSHGTTGSETLPDYKTQLKLRELEQVHNQVVQEKESLCERNEALEQRVQELIKQLRDGKEAKKREAQSWPQEVEEFKSILADVKVFQSQNDTMVSDTESLRQRNKDLDQEVKEAKYETLIEKRVLAGEQIKACQREDASSDELQTLRILVSLKMKEIDQLRTEVMSLKVLAAKE